MVLVKSGKPRGSGGRAPKSRRMGRSRSTRMPASLSQPQRKEVREDRMSLGEPVFRERIESLLDRLVRPPPRGAMPKRPGI